MNALFVENHLHSLGLNSDASNLERNLRLKQASSVAFEAPAPSTDTQSVDCHVLNAPCPPASTTVLDGLPSRMRVLIRSEGSMASIARRCGFSEGAVRSWRDGHSDMSRERCVVMARTLGISLLWLITGSGQMKEEHPIGQFQPDTQNKRDSNASLHKSSVDHPEAASSAGTSSVNPRLLGAAIKLLQSYIGLLGGSLNPVQRANALAELYDILGASQGPIDIDRLISFHTFLNTQVRRGGSLVV